MSQEPTRTAVGRRRRAKRPERIALGNDDEAVRNDLVALEEGTSERTLNRGDKEGAPFLMIGGCKYRPINEYRRFRASRIQRKNPPRRRVGSGRAR